jgi:pimeloyl-ACP methyl ester carboxylesterase
MINTLSFFCLFALSTSTPVLQKHDRDSSITIDVGYVNVDGGKLFYEMAGEGEYIVLIHDGVVHREIWDGQFPVLAKNNRVVRYDRRGYGRSPNSQSPYSNIEDLNQLFTQLKIDKATLFGMSAGGGLAIDFTLEYPAKVNALVLVGAVVSGYGYSSHMLTRGGRINSFAELVKDPKKTIKYLGWEDPYTIYPKNIKAKNKCLKLLEENPINVNRDKYIYLRPPRRPAADFLSEIQVPALILVGEYDIPDVQAHAGVIEFGIPNAKREIMPRSGHLIPLEKPDLFNAAVLKFMVRYKFTEIMNSKGVDAAVQYFHKKREHEPDIVLFDELEMNSLGYSFLQNGKIKDAIELFKLNTIMFPDSGNVFDSLGEAYLKDGQKDLAIENYEKSIEIDPSNANAKEILKSLIETK